MKDPLNRTKVVLRHLPPSISQSALMEHVYGRFSGRYKWFSFRPGKNSQKNQCYSQAYIDFQSPEDVIDFAEFFDGHIFVNEKGAQFKAVVEYAPSQRVPKVSSKKDGREGTIFKDPEYVEFLEFIAKPVENLPSAEFQLERREAERTGGPKEAVIVTPLMDFIRQRRAAKNGSQKSSANGKLSRRAGESSTKRGSEKRRGPTSLYVLRDSTQTSSNGKEKSTYMLVSRIEEQGSRTEVSEDGTIVGSNGTIPVVSGSVGIGKGRVVLLKGKEKEASQVSGGLSKQQHATVSVKNLIGSSSKQSQQQDASGRIIRSTLTNKNTRQCQSYLAGMQPEQQRQAVNSQRDKRLPCPPKPRLLKDHITSTATHSSISDINGKRSLDDKAAVSNLHCSVSIGNKNEKRMRNRDMPDRGVWASRRSDGFHFDDDISHSAWQLSHSLEGISVSQRTVGHTDGNDDMAFQSSHRGCGSNSMAAYDAPLSQGEMKHDVPSSNRNGECRSGRVSISPAENGVHRHSGRRGSAHGMKEVDGSLNFSEGKPSKRGVSAGFGPHERQVWVQKSCSGS